VTLTLPRAQRVLVLADAAYDGDNSGAAYSGLCEIVVDGSQLGAAVKGGSTTGTGPGYNANGDIGLSLNGITGTLTAGPHSIGLDCNDAGGTIEYSNTTVSTLSFGG
jgi:hypothetical protein